MQRLFVDVRLNDSTENGINFLRTRHIANSSNVRTNGTKLPMYCNIVRCARVAILRPLRDLFAQLPRADHRTELLHNIDIYRLTLQSVLQGV